MAISPAFSAERFSAKPQVSIPGDMHLFCSTISVSALTPASLLTVAFIVSGSKNLPPLFAEALAEEEERVAGVDDASAIHVRLVLLGQEAGDIAELLIVLGRRQIVAVSSP